MGYIVLNLELLYDILKAKTQSWSDFPLGVMGRINPVKMILLPKLLYIFSHAPLYIPLRIFKSMESIVTTFIWGTSRHKLSWRACPVDLGDTALPDLSLYYIASQLSRLFYFSQTDKIGYSTLVCSQASRLIVHPF